jgi:hypothetical protein
MDPDRIWWLGMRDRSLEEAELSKRGASAAEELARDDPLWPGQLAIAAALALYLILPPKLTIGPNWVLPAAELVVLAALVAATPRGGRTPKRRRVLALSLVLVATVANLVAVGLLTHYLVIGGHARGADLINGGAVRGTRLEAALRRLPLRLTHEPDRIQPHGHHAAHSAYQVADGRPERRIAHHRRHHRRACGEHPVLMSAGCDLLRLPADTPLVTDTRCDRNRDALD